MQDYGGNDIYCDLIIPKRADGRGNKVRLVKETDNILAFYHTKPYWPTHIVVAPKQHVDSLLTLDVDSDIVKDLLKVVKEIAESIKNKHGSCRVLTNLGDYQDSKHLHVHISQGQPLHQD